ncbi:MAG TPA: hypothetical protein VKA60_02795 [Blastocatellia bacterium]|nr:hypothetical protein [Blastocatellia bacterium]
MTIKAISTLHTKLTRMLWLVALLFAALVANAAAQDYHRIEVFGGYSLARTESNITRMTFTSPGSGSGSFTDLCSQATGEMLGQNSQKFFCERRNLHGFDGSVALNLSRYFGVKADFTGHYRSESFVDVFPTPVGNATQTIRVREHLHQFLFGLQVKDNGVNARWKPFAHALLGAARYTNRESQDIDLFPDFNYVARDRATSFALKLGGGLDVRLARRLDLRVVELDYNPIFAGDRGFETVSGPFTFDVRGRTAHNYTLSFGIAIH